VRTDDVDVSHGASVADNEAWQTKRHEWVDAMWANRGNIRILRGGSEELKMCRYQPFCLSF
jgi:hypothetical protein